MKIRTSGPAPAMGALAGTAAAMALLSAQAQAQEGTRIVAATVYPDSASVERELRVPGGTRHITIACVPAAVDVGTLQVDGDAQARIGDVRATDLPPSRAQECAPPVSLARRQALALQRASLESQRDANDLALGFLHHWGAGPHADDGAAARGNAPAGVARPAATASELRRSALDLLTDQARIRRELAALALEETRVADDQPTRSDWRPGDGERFEIAMGQDDLMHVDTETPGSFTQARGVFGGSVERTSTAVYAIVNRHPAAVSVELLDAAPVSRNEAITVTHQYDPAPATTDWNKVTGVAAWRLDVPAQGTRRVSITHSVTAPKGMTVANLP